MKNVNTSIDGEYIFECLSQGMVMCLIDSKGLIKKTNSLFSDKIGISQSYLENENINNLVISKKRDLFFKDVKFALSSGMGAFSTEFQMNTRHDKVFWVYATFIPMKNSEDEIDILMLGIDITNKKIQEERLRILEFASGLGTWDWHLQTNKVNFDQRLCQMIGYEQYELEHSFMTWSQLIHPDDKGAAQEAISKYLNNETESYEVKFRLKHKMGHFVWILAKGKIVEYDENKQPLRFSGTHMDYSYMKQLESNLELEKRKSLHAAKLAALGEMAGSVAHEINTPLATIGLASELIESEVLQAAGDLNSIISNLEIINSTVKKVSDVIDGLREFSASDVNQKVSEVNLELVIVDTIKLCQQKLKSHGFEVNLKTNSKINVVVKKVQLEQVLLNLINNSYDALIYDDEKWIKIETIICGEFVKIIYSDSGAGIDATIVEKMFQPFFSTKPADKGTGLGMSISLGIIESFNGHFYYKQQNGHTGFEIMLPI